MKEADLMKNKTLTLDNRQSDPDMSNTRLPDKVWYRHDQREKIRRLIPQFQTK